MCALNAVYGVSFVCNQQQQITIHTRRDDGLLGVFVDVQLISNCECRHELFACFTSSTAFIYLLGTVPLKRLRTRHATSMLSNTVCCVYNQLEPISSLRMNVRRFYAHFDESASRRASVATMCALLLIGANDD